jgi:hypothetical protein
MMCECYKIGGRFIAEDPDCPAHGTEAQKRDREREENRDDLFRRVAELRAKQEALHAEIERFLARLA